MSLPNGFLRSKLKDPAELSKLLAKVEAVFAKKQNAFNVEFKGLKMEGAKMTNVVFDVAKITFTFGGVDYELAHTDILMFKRLRTKKYMFKTNVLTIVP